MFIFLLLQSVFVFGEAMTSVNQYNSYNASTYDVCQTEFTMQHYQNGKCVEIERPILPGSKEMFKLRSVVLTERVDGSDNYPTMILIPGGPGESSGMLRYVLNSKDMLNGMIVHLDHRVVMYDPRGTGTSKLLQPAEKYDKAVFSEARMVEDLSALIDAVSPNKPVVLVAHSAGGATALKLAEMRSNRVSKIVLASTSVSPRHMGELNLMQYSKQPARWENYLKTAKGDPAELAELNKKYLFIEDVLIQQLKAKVIKQYINPKVRQTPLDIRMELTLSINSDPSGESVKSLVNTTYQKLLDIESQSGIPLVTPDLRKAKIVADLKADAEKFVKGEWIKVAVMCGEGMTPEETERDSFFDGLKMSWYCNNFSSVTPVEIDLKNVKTPVLFFTGITDSIIPLSEATRITSELPNAELVVSNKAGHAVFYEDPAIFFFKVEKFLK